MSLFVYGVIELFSLNQGKRMSKKSTANSQIFYLKFIFY